MTLATSPHRPTAPPLEDFAARGPASKIIQTKYPCAPDRGTLHRVNRALGIAPVCALAFVSALAASGLAYADEPPPAGFSFGPGETIEHDSNILRNPAGQSPSAYPVVSETIYTTDLLGAFHQTYGRQVVSVSALLAQVHYQHLSQFNYTQEDIQAALQSSLPYKIDTSVAVARTAQLANFADIGAATRDVIVRNSLKASVDFPIAVDWRPILGGSVAEQRNLATAYETQDLNTAEIDAGIRFQPTTGNYVDLLLTSVRGTYPNNSPAALVPPGYRDRGADLRVDWTFSGSSHAQGHAGYVRRSDDILVYLDQNPASPTFNQLVTLNENFAGPVVDLTYDWQFSAQSKLTFFVLRQTGAAGDNNYLSAVTRTVRITPSYRPTEKIRLDAYAEWSQRNYLSQVYQAVSGALPGVTRLDTSRYYGVGASWTPWRWLKGSIDLHREQRDSTIAIYSYGDNVVTGSLQGTF